LAAFGGLKSRDAATAGSAEIFAMLIDEFRRLKARAANNRGAARGISFDL
jgi:hypothetical protein